MRRAAPSRDSALDFMRAVAIVLVVFGHVQRGLVDAGALQPDQLLYQAYLFSDYAIYTFHVPVFFVVSGFLLEARPGLSSGGIARRTLHLVGLYLIWNTLNAVPAALFSDLINRRGQDVWSFFDPLQPSGIMWFFVALIAAHAAYLVVRKVVFLRYAVMAAAALVLALEADRLGIAYGCLWFFAGAELRRTQVPDRLPPSGWIIAAGLALFALATASSYRLGVPASAAFVSCAAALICLYAAGRRLSPSRAVTVLGRETLAIYVMHVIAAAAVRIVMLKLLEPDFYPLILVLATVAGIGLPVLAVEIARRLGVSRFLLLGQAADAGFRSTCHQVESPDGRKVVRLQKDRATYLRPIGRRLL